MIIDSHEHIMFPTKIQLDKMDAAGVDKTILFCSAPHPEKANTLNELETEMNTLYRILAGANEKADSIRRIERNILEVVAAIEKYPNRFLGFGSVPLGLNLEETQDWIEAYITSHSLCGIENLPPAMNNRLYS